MIIKWYGQTCFRITAQKGKNNPVNILIDPFSSAGGKEKGLRSPKLEADIFLLNGESEEWKNKLSSFDKEGFLISGPGEYDLKGVYIQGIQAKTKNKTLRTIIYAIEGEKIKICHLGRFGQEELLPEQIERIGEVDILMVPIEGKESLDPKEAIKVMAQIEPKIIIPMNYQFSKKQGKADKLAEFLKGLGIKSLQPLPKLSIRKKDLSEDEAKIIALEI